VPGTVLAIDAGPDGQVHLLVAGSQRWEAWSAALAGDDVDVEAVRVVIPVGIVERRLGAAFLRHSVLLGGDPAPQLVGRRPAIAA